jgi:hypothetical protein
MNEQTPNPTTVKFEDLPLPPKPFPFDVTFDWPEQIIGTINEST